MKLTNIVNLYNEMRSNQLFRQRFNFEYNKVKADVFFLIDESPFILLFGIRHKNTYFEIKVQKGFIVNDRIDKKIYSAICEAFEIQYSSNHVFKPTDFFTAFNERIPQKIRDTYMARPSDIIRYKREVEEADKIYFWRFRNNAVNEQVSDENLEKTRLLMGIEAYERCKKENISTQWTDDLEKDNYDNWKLL